MNARDDRCRADAFCVLPEGHTSQHSAIRHDGRVAVAIEDIEPGDQFAWLGAAYTAIKVVGWLDGAYVIDCKPVADVRVRIRDCETLVVEKDAGRKAAQAIRDLDDIRFREQMGAG